MRIYFYQQLEWQHKHFTETLLSHVSFVFFLFLFWILPNYINSSEYMNTVGHSVHKPHHTGIPFCIGYWPKFPPPPASAHPCTGPWPLPLFVQGLPSPGTPLCAGDLPRYGHVQTCSIWTSLYRDPSSPSLKLVQYEARTVGKRTVGTQLKCFLVMNKKRFGVSCLAFIRVEQFKFIS